MTDYLYLKNSKHKGAIVIKDGFNFYNLNRELHREDGPAIVGKNGDKKWYLNNKLHRTDGPAVELGNGKKAWFLNGKKVTKEEVMGKIWKKTWKKIWKKIWGKKDIVTEEIFKKYL